LISFAQKFFDYYKLQDFHKVLDSCLLVLGNFQTQSAFYNLMMQKPAVRENRTFSEIERNILKKVTPFLGKLQVAFKPSVTRRLIRKCEIKPGTYAGLRYEKFLKKGKKTILMKEEHASEGLFLAETIFKKVTQGEICGINNLFSCGGREKRESDRWEDGKILSSRGVMMPELHHVLLEGTASRPVEKHFFDKDSGPIYLGQGFAHRGWERLKRDLEWSDTVIEGDWKKFDNNVLREHILVAFSIVRSFYGYCKKMDRLFQYLCANYIEKILVTPGAYCFKYGKGIPSGSGFTALVGSLVNFILLSIICYDLNIKANQVRFAIGGDDFLIFIRGSCDRPKIRSYLEDFPKKYGLEIKGLRICDPFSDNINECPSFYKTCIYKGLPTVRPDHLFEQVALPLSKARGSKNVLEFIQAYLVSVPYLFDHIRFFINYSLVVVKENNVSLEGLGFFDFARIQLKALDCAVRNTRLSDDLKRDKNKLRTGKKRIEIYTSELSLERQREVLYHFGLLAKDELIELFPT